MYCSWRITSPPGYQVELIVFDLETSGRSLYIYDSPSLLAESYYTIASLRGSLDSSFHFTSSRGEYLMHYDDQSGTSHTRGFVFEAHIGLLGMLGEYCKMND